MNLRYLLSLFLALAALSGFSQSNSVQISPLEPKIGDRVSITFRAQHSLPAPNLVFSYGNLYELPTILPLKFNGEHWETSFVVPRYAKYASFYIKQGDSIYKPEAKKHYELIFYKDGKPVFDTYLYKSYSLAAQMGKSDSLKTKTNYFLRKELSLYPSNYAAKLRLLANQMADDKVRSKIYLDSAMQLIDRKLKDNPTDMGNINQVTMGYIIMSKNSMIDTLRTYLLTNYPKSEVAYEFLYEMAYKTKDRLEQVKKLEQLLSYKASGENSTLSGIHQKLFEFYAEQKNEAKALMHARGVAAVKNPWLARELKEIAMVLANQNLALDTAKKYAERALGIVDTYPLGVIRYFPEYGYIPGYVANRPALIEEQKGEILSIIGNIYAQQRKYELAEKTLKQALALSKNNLVYQNLASMYEQTKQPKLAFEMYRKMMLEMPVDTVILNKFKRNYLAYHGKVEGFDQQLASLRAEWESQNLPRLKAGKLNVSSPLFAKIYDMNGTLVDPGMVKDKVVVLDFWATWCVPCIEGFPYMQKVYDQYKNNKDVVFMVVNSGSKNSLQDAITWAKQNKFTFPIYYNDRNLAEAFNVTTIPSTFVIDKEGKIQYKTVGFEGPIMQAKLALQIKDLLAQ